MSHVPVNYAMFLIVLAFISATLLSCNNSEEHFEQLLQQFDSLYAAGQYPQAEQTGNQLWAISEIPERLVSEYASVLEKMQLVTAQQGKYNESERFCQAALVLLKKLNKQYTPAYLSSLTNLTRIYYYQGKYRESLDLLWQLVHFRETQHPKDTILYYDYYYLGQALSANGYDEQGISYIEKSYLLMGDSVGDMETKYELLTSLANGYHMLGQPDKAKIWIDSTIHFAVRWKGQHSIEYAQALKVQSQYSYSQGNLVAAEQQGLEALAIAETSESPYTMNFANSLGEYYSLQGNFSKADSFFNIAIETMNKFSIGQTNPVGFSELYYRYALHLIRVKRYDQAKNALQEILAIQEKAVGNDKPKVQSIKRMLDSAQTLLSRTQVP